jgi:3-hydroxypropanoate dehydrogenase
LFRSARRHSDWLDRAVDDNLLRELYGLMKWDPTSANCTPARLVFVRTPQANERLKPRLAAGNVNKSMTAPVVAIIGMDMEFYEKLPGLFPYKPGARVVRGEAGENPRDRVPQRLAAGRWFHHGRAHGHGDPIRLHPRGPRLEFDEVCRIV